MKRVVAAVLIAVLCAAMCLCLTGCEKPKVRVRSVLSITNEFKGTRTITVIYPLKAKIDDIKDDIIDDFPADDVAGVDFEYTGAGEDGYTFVLTLTFDTKDQYEEQVSAIIGRTADVVYSHKETPLFSGTRIAEDFGADDLIDWIESDTAANSSTKKYSFIYPDNTVKVGKETYETDTTVSVNDCDGVEMDYIEIKTYNEKRGAFDYTFDRSFVFAVPSDVYTENKRKINDYFEDLLDGEGEISDTHEGNNVLYTITLEGLDESELEDYTALILGSDNVSVDYGDNGDLSTPLLEGRVLEETLDTHSFYGTSGNAPSLHYTYSLETDVVRREGFVYEDGRWTPKGSWDDGAYRLTDDSGMTRVRVFGGRQYTVNEIDVSLTTLGDGRFRRVTTFVYPEEDGYDGPKYATKYFIARDADAECELEGDTIVCRITCEGKISEINDELENIFGKGNHISFDRRSDPLSDKTTFSDSIDLRNILSGGNADVPLYYSVISDSSENIVTLTSNGKETAYTDGRIKVTGGTANVGYHGVIPKGGSVMLYILFGGLLLAATIYIAYRMTVPPESSRRRSAAQTAVDEMAGGDPDDDLPSAAPMQTTTFSIFELGRLSRNKKYVDEINKDVEDRLHAGRIEAQKKEIRAKELEELEKKVYGDEKADPAEAPAELPVIPAAEETLPPDDTPKTVEILEALEIAPEDDPQPAETTDPAELLKLMNEEDADEETDSL